MKKESIYCIVDATDNLDLNMEQIQGGRKTVGTIKCKNGEVEIKTDSKEMQTLVQI